MANKNWSQIGDEIESMVRSALESQDFGKLNESIARTADEALDNVERSVQKAMDIAHEKMGKYYKGPGNGSYNRNNGSYGNRADGQDYGAADDSFHAGNRREKGMPDDSFHAANGRERGMSDDSFYAGSGNGGQGSGNGRNGEHGRNSRVYTFGKVHYSGNRQSETYNEQKSGHIDYSKSRRYEQSTVKSTRFEPGYEKARANNGTQLLRERFRSTAGMNSTGVVLTACGYSFLGILILVLGIILAVTLPGHSKMALTTTAIMTPFIAGSAFMAYKGTSLLTRTRRFRRYVETLREREYCQIQELADSLGKSESFVKKDLSKMIKKRLFLHGHLDKQQTCLMVTDNAYEQYQLAERQLEERQKEEKRKAEEDHNLGRRKDLPEEAKKVIAAGKEYLEEIRKCNDQIPGVEISEKISRLELVISKIFNRVEQHPELVDDLGRFMDYYLPTTVKLLKAYEELDSQPVQGENIMTSKKQIEETLDTIDQAFEKLLDSFFEEAAWDISSDISVLHNMFAQEGLTESEFEKLKVK